MIRRNTWSDEEVIAALFRFETLGQSGAVVANGMGVSRSAVLGTVHRMKQARLELDARRLGDSDILAICDGLFLHKTSAEALAKRFALSRNAILYLGWWVMNDLAHAGDDQVLRPDNADAVNWPYWWRTLPRSEVAA